MMTSTPFVPTRTSGWIFFAGLCLAVMGTTLASADNDLALVLAASGLRCATAVAFAVFVAPGAATMGLPTLTAAGFAAIALSGALDEMGVELLLASDPDQRRLEWVCFAESMLASAPLVAVATGVRLHEQAQTLREELLARKRDEARAELSRLRAQLHPHVMFNSLNNIYALVEEKSQAGAALLLKLTSVLRHILYEKADRAPLAQELAFTADLIEVLRAGAPEHCAIKVDLEAASDGETRIAPFLFTPLIENAFKHLGGAAPFIQVSAAIADGRVTFETVNSFAPSQAGPRPGGLGLENLRRRLALSYPQTGRLELNAEAGRFHARLSFDLTEPAPWPG